MPANGSYHDGADLRVENGGRFRLSEPYTQMPNRILDEWVGPITRELGGSHVSVLSAVVRLTLGYGRESAPISLSRLSKLAGLSRNRTREVLESLGAAGAIRRVPTGEGRTPEVGPRIDWTPSDEALARGREALDAIAAKKSRTGAVGAEPVHSSRRVPSEHWGDGDPSTPAYGSVGADPSTPGDPTKERNCGGTESVMTARPSPQDVTQSRKQSERKSRGTISGDIESTVSSDPHHPDNGTLAVETQGPTDGTADVRHGGDGVGADRVDRTSEVGMGMRHEGDRKVEKGEDGASRARGGAGASTGPGGGSAGKGGGPSDANLAAQIRRSVEELQGSRAAGEVARGIGAHLAESAGGSAPESWASAAAEFCVRRAAVGVLGTVAARASATDVRRLDRWLPVVLAQAIKEAEGEPGHPHHGERPGDYEGAAGRYMAAFDAERELLSRVAPRQGGSSGGRPAAVAERSAHSDWPGRVAIRDSGASDSERWVWPKGRSSRPIRDVRSPEAVRRTEDYFSHRGGKLKREQEADGGDCACARPRRTGTIGRLG